MAGVERIKPYGDDSRPKERQIAAMFDNIASAYDFMNAAMTFGMHNGWQRRLVDTAVAAANEKASASAGDDTAVGNGAPQIVDLATGTGAVALALRQRLPDAHITGIDISAGMLDVARSKPGADGIDFRCADALATGLADESVDVVTIAYGVRNYADLPAGLKEMHRILRHGGRVCMLELSEPPHFPVRQLYKLYTRAIIPLVGRVVSGDHSAYRYLPRSIASCPQRRDMADMLVAAGFADASWRSFCLGVCTLYTAVR